MIGELQYSIFNQERRVRCRTVWATAGLVSSAETESDPLSAFISLLTGQNVHGIRLAFARQVHGPHFSYTERGGPVEDCDGLYTGQPELNLVIRTADCAAVMIYMPGIEMVANLHVGWRGAYQQIIGNGIGHLISEYSLLPGELRVAVSPCIHRCCYEVGDEFYRFFPEQFLHRKTGKIFFDLPGFIRQQLEKTGIPGDQLEFSEHCTVCSRLKLPSFRRDGTKNRLLNMIEKTGV
jgi:YfiH family protein